MSIANQEDCVESGHASNHNKTPKSASTSGGSNGDTEHVASAGAADTDNIGREPEQEGKAGNGDIVIELRELLGQDVVLIPVHTNTKRPVHNGWPQTTIAAMADPAYVARLCTGNIGVALGSNSNGLCAIDVDDDNEVEPFLALNPLLRFTLRTRGARGAQLWVRIAGVYPALVKLKTQTGENWGEWRCDGGQSVIHGIHPDGMRYQSLVDAHPIEIAFTDIVWPEHLKLPWVEDEYDRLVREHGEDSTRFQTHHPF